LDGEIGFGYRKESKNYVNLTVPDQRFTNWL